MAAVGGGVDQRLRQERRLQYLFVANESEAFSVFGRQEVQEINRIRTCTDLPFCVLFCLVLIAMAVLRHDAYKLGNVTRLFEPIDFRGRLCGYDPDVEDKPLGYHPNPYSYMIVCVPACPKTAADGNFTLPDGPMGKYFVRHSYPTSQIIGQYCLPIDLHLAKHIVAVKDVQTEAYKSLGTLFADLDVLMLLLGVPLIVSCIYCVMLYHVPKLAIILALAVSGITLLMVSIIIQFDFDLLMDIPLYPYTHPVYLRIHPYVRDLLTVAGCLFFLYLLISLGTIERSQHVFKEALKTVYDKSSLVVVALCTTCFKIFLLLQVSRQTCLLMSIIRPVNVQIEFLGEWRYVERKAWATYYLYALFFNAFGAYWLLEFVGACNKYVTGQVLAQQYFMLISVKDGVEVRGDRAKTVDTLRYAFWSLIRYHLGSCALFALLAIPVRSLRFFIKMLVPDRPNLWMSHNRIDRIAYYFFWPLIMLDLHFLRFFKDSPWVILALKGTSYVESARRAEGLLNRSRGKIPNLSKMTQTLVLSIVHSTGVTCALWCFFVFRQPRVATYHRVPKLHQGSEAVEAMFEFPQHSPVLTLPVMFCFGLWIASGTLHLVNMATEVLTLSYCIDVEMAGGTETDALYVPHGLSEVYKDLGGGDSERELANAMAQGAVGF